MRIIFVALIMCFYVCIALMFTPWFKINQNAARKRLQYVTRGFARLISKVIGLKVESNYTQQPFSSLMIANHMSYLDILAILTVFPTCFITSNDLKETPILGHVCRLAGCLFVERRHPHAIIRDIDEISHALKGGYDVFLFPEAQATNGDYVKPFKRSLFKSARHADKKISMFVLNYKFINGDKVCLKTRDLLCWYGDMTFFTHFWSLLAQKEYVVQLDYIGSIESDITDDVTELAKMAHQSITQKFVPFS